MLVLKSVNVLYFIKVNAFFFGDLLSTTGGQIRVLTWDADKMMLVMFR